MLIGMSASRKWPRISRREAGQFHIDILTAHFRAQSALVRCGGGIQLVRPIFLSEPRPGMHGTVAIGALGQPVIPSAVPFPVRARARFGARTIFGNERIAKSDRPDLVSGRDSCWDHLGYSAASDAHRSTAIEKRHRSMGRVRQTWAAQRRPRTSGKGAVVEALAGLAPSQTNIPACILVSFKFHIETMKRRLRKHGSGEIVHLLMYAVAGDERAE